MPNENIDVDQLLNEIESPKEPMGENAVEPAQQEAKPVENPWNGEDLAFDWNGKRIVPDSKDKAIQWQSMGYNYSQRMGELNKTHAQRMNEIEQLKTKYTGFDKYGEVDNYAKTNPEWWDHVQKSYQTRETYKLDESLQPILNPLVERLSQTENFLNEWKQEKQQQELQAQDAKLDADIKSTQEQYPTIDLSAIDPASGETLELKVLKHASELGTSSFKTAFRDYFHDKLIDLAKSQALEGAAKGQADLVKKGVIGKTTTPTKGLSLNTHRGKSYDQLTQEALAELGIG